ncbi:phosphodiesterase [Polycladidibacter hongkongensis]|uniref:phosphodiesterase n=1 Tax=Polycladidibacter hongkongensis TaxID=1647556 RepID=UPI00082A5BC0|nr:phosphodiesterase [Pseudovibrio hongkongensis]
MLIAQISDCHLTKDNACDERGVDRLAQLQRAVDFLQEQWPELDAVVVSGDVSDDGTAASYAQAKDALAHLPCPAFVLPGNHDLREPMRTAFAAQGYLPAQGPLCYAQRIGDLQIVALDSLEEGQVAGVFCEQQATWLEGQLKASAETPTLVFVHHPPFATGLTGVDEICLREGRERFWEVLAPHPQVLGVASGHIHHAMSAVHHRTAGALLVSTCQGLACQFHHDLIGDAMGGASIDPLALRLFKYADGQLSAHLRSL